MQRQNVDVVQKEFDKSLGKKLLEALVKAMRATYVDPILVKEGMFAGFPQENTDRSIAAGFFGFRRNDYTGVKGKALIAWDILTWIPTVAVNTVALFTEVLPLTLVKLAQRQSTLIKMANAQNHTNESVGAGYKAAYYTGSFLYFFGRALTSPSKNIQACFIGFKKKSTLGKAAAIAKAIGSGIFTAVAYTFLFPLLVAAIAATPVLAILGTTIIGGGYLVSHAITALSSIPVVGPAIKDLGAVILKGLNSIPYVNKFVTWLMPTKPTITIIPGHPAETLLYNQQAFAAAQAKAEFVKAEVATGFLSSLVAMASGFFGKGVKSATNKVEKTIEPHVDEFKKRFTSNQIKFPDTIKPKQGSYPDTVPNDPLKYGLGEREHDSGRFHLVQAYQIFNHQVNYLEEQRSQYQGTLFNSGNTSTQSTLTGNQAINDSDVVYNGDDEKETKKQIGKQIEVVTKKK